MRNILLVIRSYIGFIYKSLYSYISSVLIGKKTKMILVDNDDCLFLVDKKDLGVGLSLRQSGTYNNDEYNELLNNVNRNSVVLVLGPHIGAHIIPLAKKVKRIDAIEANPDTFKILSLNILINKCANINVHNFAAGNDCGKVSFLTNTVNSGGSKITPKVKKISYYYDFPKEITVNVKRLDDVLEPVYDVVTMDIEGSEMYALQGMDNILKRCHTLILEFSPDHLKNVSNTPISDFSNLVSKYFDSLIIPGDKSIFLKDDFYCILSKLYTENKHKDNLIFKK